MICIGNKRIQIKQADITAEPTDAIVNPANSQLMHGGRGRPGDCNEGRPCH